MADSLLKMQIESVVDHRTTPICLHANGMIVPAGEPFETLNGTFDAPPFHLHCRSIVRPWVSGFISQARAEANAELQNRPLAERRIKDRYLGTAELPPPVATNMPRGKTLADSALEQARAARVAAKTERLRELIAKQTATPAARTWSDAEYASRYDKWVAKMDLHERSAIDSYGAGATYINAALRQGVALDKGAELMASSWEKFFAKHAFALDEDLLVRRGVYNLGGFDPEAVFTKLLAENKPFIEKGWMSTTTSDSMMAMFKGQWQYEITVPKGTRVAFASKGQQEVVLERGSQFHILSVDPEKKLVKMVKVESQAALVPFAGKEAFQPVYAASTALRENRIVRRYSASWYGPINQSLRGFPVDLWGTPATQEQMQKVVEYIDGLDTAFKTAPRLTEAALTYRGGLIGCDSWQVGQNVVDAGFTSTSAERSVAERFDQQSPLSGGWITEIELPAGTPHIVVSDWGDESEILLGRNASFTVVSRDDAAKVVRIRYESSSVEGSL